jgi:hypothetical protein
MKKDNEDTVRDQNVHRQLKGSLSFRGKFRVSKKRLRAIGRKGFERMEGLNHSDLGGFSE